MTTDTWTCRCGAVALEVDTTSGTRAVCYCESCRGFAERLGKGDILDEWGGADLYQTAAEAGHFLRGADQVAWTRMTEKGPLRWYTTCCQTPLANTLATPAIPFLTLQSAFFGNPDGLGPVAARVNRKTAKGRVPDDAGGVGRLLREFFLRSARSRLNGGWKRNPFFDAARKPIAAEVPLSD